MNGSPNSSHDVTRERPATQGAPRWLIKLALSASVLALIATSAPPEWRVGDSAESTGSHFTKGGFRVQQAEGTVLYRTPRGQWRLEVDTMVKSYELGVRYRVAATFDVDERLRTTSEVSNRGNYVVACDEKLCEGSIQVLLRLEPIDDNVPAEGALMTLGDGGLVPLDPPAAVLHAEFRDQKDVSPIGCGDDDNDAPEEVGLEVTVTPLSFDPTSGTIRLGDGGTDAGTDGGSSASTLGANRGLDAGL